MAPCCSRRQRAQLRKSSMRIEKPFGLRTLKRSARKQIERERASSLWIFPGDDNRNLAVSRAHSPASLLGLPTELRQKILCMSLEIEELEQDMATIREEDKKKAKRLDWAKTMSPILLSKMDKAMLAKFGLRWHESELVVLLSRKISAFSSISPLIHQEMPYVAKQGQFDLEKHLNHEGFRIHRPIAKVIPARFEWLFAPNIGPLAPPGKKSQLVKLKGHQTKKKVRPKKCWYCTERHFGDDPVCPMARYDSGKWRQLTKDVSGKRGMGGGAPTFRGEKVMFEA